MASRAVSISTGDRTRAARAALSTAKPPSRGSITTRRSSDLGGPFSSRSSAASPSLATSTVWPSSCNPWLMKLATLRSSSTTRIRMETSECSQDRSVSNRRRDVVGDEEEAAQPPAITALGGTLERAAKLRQHDVDPRAPARALVARHQALEPVSEGAVRGEVVGRRWTGVGCLHALDDPDVGLQHELAAYLRLEPQPQGRHLGVPAADRRGRPESGRRPQAPVLGAAPREEALVGRELSHDPPQLGGPRRVALPPPGPGVEDPGQPCHRQPLSDDDASLEAGAAQVVERVARGRARRAPPLGVLLGQGHECVAKHEGDVAVRRLVNGHQIRMSPARLCVPFGEDAGHDASFRLGADGDPDVRVLAMHQQQHGRARGVAPQRLLEILHVAHRPMVDLRDDVAGLEAGGLGTAAVVDIHDEHALLLAQTELLGHRGRERASADTEGRLGGCRLRLRLACLLELAHRCGERHRLAVAHDLERHRPADGRLRHRARQVTRTRHLAAGEPSVTDVTGAPSVRVSRKLLARSAVRGWMPTPSQPRVTWPAEASWVTTGLARLTGIAKPMPTDPPLRLTIAVLMPITCPRALISGPPLLPGLIE